jgi:hypothetical protein
MLSTINGFDLLLIIIITILGFKVYNLTRECESYVQQILKLSWELQEEIAVNLPKDLYGCVCNYCTDSDPWLSECQDSIGTPPNTYNKFCNYCLEIEQRVTGDECTCESYDGQVTIPTGTRPKCTAPDPMKCDCDDCWLIPTKYF